MYIRKLELNDLESVRVFTDKGIGKNYFSAEELRANFEKSSFAGVMCSFVLVDDADQIMGLRLAYPPGAWSKGKGNKLRPDLWNVPIEKVGYFQSLFLSDEAQGLGFGPKLSDAAILAFKELGALAVVTHAWKESPNNSSIKYLKRFGFEIIATHKHYWIDVDYECSLDGKPCKCTAEEMIKYL